MALLKAPSRTAPSNAPATRATQPPPQQAAVIFPRAARHKNAFAFQVGPTALSAVAQPQNPIEIPAQGFLRWIELEVTVTAAANAAAVALAADAPFSVLSSIALTNAAGDPLQVAMTGYQQMLMDKYGVLSQDPPEGDPRQDPQFTQTTGAAGAGGSVHFYLRVPCELDPRDAFCAIPNLASNKSYNLLLTLAPLSSVYTTAPTNPPTITVTGIAHYWTQPKAANAKGAPQERAPRANGSVSIWRLQTPPVTPGDKYITLTNTGNVIREIIFVLRTAAGARTDADWPGICQFLVNDDPLFYLPINNWARGMAMSFGYLNRPTVGGVAASPKDGPGGLDTGVYVLYQFMATQGMIYADHPRDQYLPTLDASKLQLHGTNFGGAASTLEVITNEIKPISAAALYGKGGTI